MTEQKPQQKIVIAPRDRLLIACLCLELVLTLFIFPSSLCWPLTDPLPGYAARKRSLSDTGLHHLYPRKGGRGGGGRGGGGGGSYEFDHKVAAYLTSIVVSGLLILILLVDFWRYYGNKLDLGKVIGNHVWFFMFFILVTVFDGLALEHIYQWPESELLSRFGLKPRLELQMMFWCSIIMLLVIIASITVSIRLRKREIKAGRYTISGAERSAPAPAAAYMPMQPIHPPTTGYQFQQQPQQAVSQQQAWGVVSGPYNTQYAPQYHTTQVQQETAYKGWQGQTQPVASSTPVPPPYGGGHSAYPPPSQPHYTR